MRKNTVIMLLYQVAMYLVPLITMPYVSRVLGARGLGVFSYTSSVMSFCIVFATMGVAIYGKREIASCLTKEDRTNVFWSIFITESFMFIFVLVGYILYNVFINTAYKTASYLQIMALIGAWLDISWLFFGVENFKLAIVRNVLIRLLSLFAIFVFIKKNTDENLYVFIITLSDIVSVVPLWLLLNKYISKLNFSNLSIRKRLLPMLKMQFTAVLTNIYVISDKIILGLYAPISLVGIYDNAFKLSKVAVSIITVIGIVMLPRMTHMFAQGSDKSMGYFKKSLNLTMFVGTGCCFGIIAISPTFMPLYLGTEFNDSIIVTQILSLVLLFVAWGNVFRSQYIIPQKMDGLYIKSVMIASIINVILNLLLIPKFSIYAAAISYLITEISISVYQTYKVRNYFCIIALLLSNFVYLISAFSMMLIIFIVRSIMSELLPNILSLLMQFLFGSIFYLLFSCYLERKINNRVVDVELLYVLRKIF